MPERSHDDDPRTDAPRGLHALIDGYAVPPGHFDELRAASATPRPHWAAFDLHAADLDAAQLSQAQARIARQIHENGVTYNVHAPQGGPARAWALDVLPHILPAAEWDRLASGLRQRARLLDAIAADLYGDQRLLIDGLLPPALVLGHPGFLRACHGIRPPSGIFLHLVAFDLARTPDGDWTVVDVRTQAPSGAGYALENRITLARLFPDAFRALHVQLLAPFFRTLQQTLLERAPAGGSTPHLVLLTPGPYSETYFEQAYLARYLGFTLAEGGDLMVRDDRVFLKTVTGLQSVHGILRRLDDDYCDPLEFRADSALGVPGLVQAWRAGHVLIANAFGAGVLESPALRGYLPSICARVLGEPLQVPSVDSCWCGDAAARAIAWPRLSELAIRRAFPDGRLPAGDAGQPDASAHDEHSDRADDPRRHAAEPIALRDLDPDARAAWHARLEAAPHRYVLEAHLPLSHAPVWHGARLESRALMLRAFLVSDGRGDYRVLPGGLSRIAGGDRARVSGQRGGSSKDTWVLGDAPVERFSLLPGRLHREDVARSVRIVSSRAGEHLFWLGRYAERSENGARLLRAVLSRLHQGDALVSGWSRPIVGTCRRHGLLPRDADTPREPGDAAPHDLELALIDGLFDARTLQSLAFNIDQTVRVAGTVRDRLSSDNWRVLNQLAQTFAHRPSQPIGLAEALDRLDAAIIALVAVGGLEMAHMTRDDGWRFLSLGRHLERLLYVVTTVGEVAAVETPDEPGLLEWLLDLSDSIITYRARYMRQPEWLPVSELLVFDHRNPRSAAFQLAKLAKHVRQLPEADLAELLDDLERACAAHAVDPAQGELFAGPGTLLDVLQSCERLALRLSDAITLRYFSHVYELSHATALR